MSTASDRLARYIAAETEILLGQDARQDLGDGRGYRMLKMADLEVVRQTIKDLQRQVAAENSGGFGYSVADLSGD